MALPLLAAGKVAGKIFGGVLKGFRAARKKKKAAKIQARAEKLERESKQVFDPFREKVIPFKYDAESLVKNKLFLGTPKIAVNNEVPEDPAQAAVFPGKRDVERLDEMAVNADASFAREQRLGKMMKGVPVIGWVVAGLVAVVVLFFVFFKRKR